MSEKLGEVVATYTVAIETFSRSAKTLLQHADLLNQARNEYQKATAASRTLRTFLDTGDETLRTLMTQLERAISDSVGEPFADKKKIALMQEPVKTEAMRAGASGAGMGVVKTFP